MINESLIQQEFPELTGLKELARGGQKWVYEGEHPSDGPVVLKLIYHSSNPDAVIREIRAVEAVNSNRVPQIFAHGRVHLAGVEYIWFRERKIEGVNLRQRLRQSSLTNQEILRLTVQILEALAAAESASIVHRDVKPENIILDQCGDFWLLDFGIARHLEMSPLTATCDPFGKYTAGYAPVEQFRNIQSEIDSRADLFALGITIVEAFTGTHPFGPRSAGMQLEILKKVENGTVPLIDVPCQKSADFRDLIDAMTKKRRDQRPATVRETLEWASEIQQGGI